MRPRLLSGLLTLLFVSSPFAKTRAQPAAPPATSAPAEEKGVPADGEVAAEEEAAPEPELLEPKREEAAADEALPKGPEQLTEKFKDGAPQEDDITLRLSAGASLNTGNTRSFQANGGGDFDLMRGMNAVSAMFNFTYGIAVLDRANDDYERTAANLNSKARYDRFVTLDDSFFAAAVFRRDRFAGLDARVQGQVGYMRNFFRRPRNRLWGEGGYDLTYDNFDPDPLVNPETGAPLLKPDGTPADQSQIVHAGRLFLGYQNQINTAVTFKGGVESLFNILEGEDIRVNGMASVASKLAGDFQLELRFLAQFDNVPVPGARKLDTISQVNVIYSLL